MSDQITRAFQDAGPHTADSLAERLSGFPREAVEQALETLSAQGVLERTVREDGVAEYRYVAPDRYVQHNLDVIVNPGDTHNRPRRRRS